MLTPPVLNESFWPTLAEVKRAAGMWLEFRLHQMSPSVGERVSGIVISLLALGSLPQSLPYLESTLSEHSQMSLGR